MLYIRQPKFVMTAANKLIPIIMGPDDVLLTNEYILDVQNPANRVYLCRDAEKLGKIRVFRYGLINHEVQPWVERFDDHVITSAAPLIMDSIRMITELSTTFAQMLRTIGLEQEVPMMLPKRWLALDYPKKYLPSDTD